MRAGRAVSKEVGLSVVEAQHVATAVSEVATNAWRYAVGGEVEIERLERDGRRGVRVVVRDRGPGIADLGAALSDGVSSSGSLGVGLPGARRLMDEFELRSAMGSGTEIEMEKWAGGRARDPARWTLRREGGAVPFAQRFRNGVLLGIVAGEHAEQAAALCAAQAWRAPPDLVARCHGLHPPRRPLAVVLASLSALDGALTWLGAGPVEAAVIRLAREGHTVFRPPGPVFRAPVCSIGPSGRWVMPRLTAMLTEPSSESTWPGMATPTATTSCRSSRRRRRRVRRSGRQAMTGPSA